MTATLKRTPLFKGGIALALVKRGSAAIGDRPAVIIRGRAVTATVVKRPFYQYYGNTPIHTTKQRREV